MGSFMDMYNSQINPRSMVSAANTETDPGFGMDWLNTNAKGLGTIASIGGLGLSAYDTFFGDTAKKNKLAIESMKLQNANNKELMADKQAFQDTWAKASNGLGTVKS